MLHYRLHLQVLTRYRGVILSKRYIFIAHVDPISPP